MKKILLYQHQSSLNHGCEALVQTISKQIKNFAENEVTVSSFFKQDDEKYEFPYVDSFAQNNMWLRRYTFPWLVYQVDKRLFNNKHLQEIFMYCKECYNLSKTSDLCVAIGGDNYCYNKGKEHWPLERKMKKLGKKMMLWGCSVEPDELQGELAEHLSHFDVITARESITYQALLNSGVNSAIYLCADPAFELEIEECALPERWENGKMVGINFSPMVMGKYGEKELFRQAVYDLVETILQDKKSKIVLIPHVRLPFSDDIEELKPIYEKYKDTGRVLLIDDINLNAKQLKYLISKCKFFVGARTHATIAAYSTGVPTLAIGYSIKARGIARDLFGNEEDFVIAINELQNKGKLIEAYQKLYNNCEEIHAILEKIMPEYKKKARISGEAFKTLL